MKMSMLDVLFLICIVILILILFLICIDDSHLMILMILICIVILFCYFIVLGGVVGVSLAQEDRDFATDAKEGTINAWGRFYGGKCSKDADCAGGIAYCELKLNPQECRPVWWFWLIFSIVLAILAICLVCCIFNCLSDCVSNCCRRRR